jgi:hypothetical protein
MSFLAPLFLVGLIAIVGPILVHLTGRRKARELPFGAIELVLQAQRRLAPRSSLMRKLLLALRIAAIAAVPLALAKPYLETHVRSPVGHGPPASIVLVLDDSLSMRARLRSGRTAFEEARRRALALLDALGRSDEVALVRVSQATQGAAGGGAGEGGAAASAAVAPAHETLAADQGRVRRELSSARCTFAAGDTMAALRRAAQIVASGSQQVRRVVLLSDLTTHGFAGGLSLPWGPAGGGGGESVPELYVERFGPRPGSADADNRAVAQVMLEPAPEVGESGVRIVATVVNHGQGPVRDLPVVLRVSDGGEGPGAARVVSRAFLDVAARGSAQKVFTYRLGKDGALSGEVAIGAEAGASRFRDALPEDDARAFSARLQPAVRVLLVDGDPRAVRRKDELFYLEAALRSADPKAQGSFQVTAITQDALADRKLDDVEVLVLANVKPLEERDVARVAAFVKQGGGLLISGGDHVDPDAFSARMAPLLPSPLAGIHAVDRVGPGGFDPTSARRALGLAPPDRRHPALAVFGPGGEGLRSARFFRHLLLRPWGEGRTAFPSANLAGATDDITGPVGAPGEADGGAPSASPGPPRERRQVTVVLRFDNGAPALVEHALGKGRVMLFTSTLDRDWCDLPIRPGFLPLLHGMLLRLGHARTSELGATPVGGERHLTVDQAWTLVELRPPVAPAVVQEAGWPRWSPERITPGQRRELTALVDAPGVWRVLTSRGASPLKEEPALRFAGTLPAAESDLAALDERAVATLTAGGPATREQRPTRKVGLWSSLAAILLGALVVEAFLARRAAT